MRNCSGSHDEEMQKRKKTQIAKIYLQISGLRENGVRRDSALHHCLV